MKNPNQTRKSLKSGLKDSSFPLDIIEAYNDEYLMKFTEERVCELERNSTVFFIGRYTFDKEMFRNSNFKVEYINSTGVYSVRLDKRPDLKMEFLTAHKSKGLQADHIFIINNKKKGLGFPSRIQDDPLIQVLLDGSDDYPYAEERRLFYVAMTRAKKKVWLLVKQNDRSCFADELMTEYERYLKPDKSKRDIPKQFNESMWICPECGGRLVKRNGRNGVFIGCSNYSKFGCRYTRNINNRRYF